MQDEKLTSGSHLLSRDAPRTIRGDKRKRAFRRKLRTKDGATGIKEDLPNIVFMHIAVGPGDTSSGKPLLELCGKAENLCNL